MVGARERRPAPRTGGYRRFAWTRDDTTLREWFAGEAAARGLDLTQDRAGNQWAWWGDPDAAVAAGRPGWSSARTWTPSPTAARTTARSGSCRAFAALDLLRGAGFRRPRPIGVASFADEEGARFGIACAGSRLLTGQLDPDRARGAARRRRRHPGRGDGRGRARPGATSAPTPRRCAGSARSSSCTSSRAGPWSTSAAGRRRRSAIWPHGRWRLDLEGEANHAGTTRLEDRRDPMLGLAAAVLAARGGRAGARLRRDRGQGAGGAGRRQRHPVAGDRVARRPRRRSTLDVRAVVAGVGAAGRAWSRSRSRGPPRPRSTPRCAGDSPRVLDGAPLLSTGAGHDAGVLATAGLSTAMLFVRNPTGVSHSPAGARRAGGLPPRRRGAGAGRPRAGRMSAGAPTALARRARPAAVGPARDVLLEAADGRFTAVTPAAPPATPNGWPGVVLPGPGQRPQPRLPPRAAGAHARRRRHVLDLARGDVRRRRAAGPGHATSRWRGPTYAEMALAGITCVGEFHYLHHAPGGAPYDDPNAMGEALRAGRRGRRDPADPAGHLLPRRRADRDGHTPLDERQRRFGDGTAERWAERVPRCARRRGMRVGAAIHSVRAVPRESIGAVGRAAEGRRCTCTCRSSRRRTSLPGLLRLTPTGLLAGEGALGPLTTAVHATHLTADDIAALGRTGTDLLLLPDHRARPGRRHRPGPRPCATPGRRCRLGSDQHAVDRPVRGGARAGDARAAGPCSAGGSAPPSCCARHRATRASAGPTPAGSRSARAPTSLPSGWTRRAPPGPTRRRSLLAATAADVTPSWSTAGVVVTGGRHRLGRRRRAAAGRHRPLWEDA